MPYDLIPIAVPLVVAYISTYVLYRRGVVNRALHLRIWNILILISFLVSAGMGIILAGLIEYDITVPLGLNLIFWHGEVGIALFLILFFHLYDNWGSFRRLIGKGDN